MNNLKNLVRKIIAGRNLRKDMKTDKKYLDEHPDIAQDLADTERINLLREACGYCPDLSVDDCPCGNLLNVF